MVVCWKREEFVEEIIMGVCSMKVRCQELPEGKPGEAYHLYFLLLLCFLLLVLFLVVLCYCLRIFYLFLPIGRIVLLSFYLNNISKS